MGSVTRSITDFFSGQEDIATRLRRVFIPCRAGVGNQNINIRIFDEHSLMQEMATPQDVVNDLQTFLNALDATPGIEPAIATQLAPFTFTVTYETNFPNQGEIDRFDVNDFPIYLLTRTVPFTLSLEALTDLLIANRIPERTFVGRRSGTLAQPILEPVATYEIFEKDWADKASVLGFGIPGTYFIPNTQTRCRKIGVIKMQGEMIVNLAFPQRRGKIVSVLKHELGHMFGLTHTGQENTIMDGRYEVSDDFQTYTNDQLWVVVRSLDLLTH